MEDFFEKAPETFRGYNITKEQIDVLRKCVCGDITPEEVAKHLAERPALAPTPVEMQQRLAGLWTLLNHTAVGIPKAQPVINDIMRTIRTFPRVGEPKGEGEGVINLDDGFIWQELTDWPGQWADDFNHFGANFKLEHYPDEERQARGKAWVSANEYNARLAASGDNALAMYGGALIQGMYIIVNALESDYDYVKSEDLAAASQLFIHSGAQLWRLATGETVAAVPGSPVLMPHLRAGSLWKGENMISQERWRFWRERWVLLADRQSYTEEARVLARGVLESMNRAERGHITARARSTVT